MCKTVGGNWGLGGGQKRLGVELTVIPGGGGGGTPFKHRPGSGGAPRTHPLELHDGHWVGKCPKPGLQGSGGEQGCIRREGTSEAAPEAVSQAVGGGCRSGGGRLLSVTNAIEAGTWRQGGRLGALEGCGLGAPPFQCIPGGDHTQSRRDEGGQLPSGLFGLWGNFSAARQHTWTACFAVCNGGGWDMLRWIALGRTFHTPPTGCTPLPPPPQPCNPESHQ